MLITRKTGDLGRLIDFFFNFGSFVKEELYKPFWHRLTRQYSTKLVGDVTELEHFKNQYLKHPTNAEFKDDLDEVVGNSSECFYYKCRYDARFLWLRNRIENRGEFSNESIRKEFLSALDDLGVAEVLNEVILNDVILIRKLKYIDTKLVRVFIGFFAIYSFGQIINTSK